MSTNNISRMYKVSKCNKLNCCTGIPKTATLGLRTKSAIYDCLVMNIVIGTATDTVTATRLWYVGKLDKLDNLDKIEMQPSAIRTAQLTHISLHNTIRRTPGRCIAG